MQLLSIVSALTLAATGAPAPAAQSTQVQAPGPAGPLAGTMLDASVPGAPIVLMLPGSGPTDRDGNSPLGIRAATYRLLAEALAARGISTVRIDKRGLGGSADAVADGNAVTVSDYVQDARSWIGSLREKTGASCIWLLGHSEGALIALATAQDPSNICGLVLVAAPGKRLGDTLRDQLRANPANAPVLDQAMAAIARLEAGERVDMAGMHPALMQLFAPQVQGFLISMFSHDPASLAARVSVPMLIVQGTADIQVGEEDARRLASANRSAKLVLLPQVNHVLKQVPGGDRAANIATYQAPNLPLASGVAEAIAEFVRR